MRFRTCVAAALAFLPAVANGEEGPVAPDSEEVAPTRRAGSFTLSLPVRYFHSATGEGALTGGLEFRLDGATYSPDPGVLVDVEFDAGLSSGATLEGRQVGGFDSSLRGTIGYVFTNGTCSFLLGYGFSAAYFLVDRDGDEDGDKSVPLYSDGRMDFGRVEPGLVCSGEDTILRVTPVAGVSGTVGNGSLDVLGDVGAVTRLMIHEKLNFTMEAAHGRAVGGDVQESRARASVLVDIGLPVAFGADAEVNNRRGAPESAKEGGAAIVDRPNGTAFYLGGSASLGF